MRTILERILGFISRLLPIIVLGSLLTISYIIFNIPSFDLFNTKIVNQIKNISNLIDDSILYQRSYNDKIHNNDVVIIKIDEKTLNAFSKTDIKMLSFPKKLYSELIIKLIEEYKVSIIGFDIVFSNKSLLGVKDENILRDTFDKYNDKVVIASMPDGLKSPLCKYNNVQHGSILLFSDTRIKKTIIDTNYKVGQNCISKDNIYLGNNDTLESFGFTIFKKYYRNNTNDSKKGDIDKLFEIFKKENTPYININYFRNGDINEGTIGFKSYSLIDILNGKNIDLEGKIVLVGEVGTLLQDNHFTPVDFNRKMPGVEINANVISTFIYDSFLKEFNTKYLAIIIILLSFFILFIIFNNNIISSTISLIVIIISNVIYGIFVFGRLGLIYPVSEVIYYLVIVYCGMYIYKFFILDKDKRFLKGAFSMYVASDIVDQISKNPNRLHLKGIKGNITILFSDIESFTSISEKMEAQLLFDYLNRYFSKMTEVLLKNSGTLDKYIGDAIMGFFNAPLFLKRHEFYACKTALEQLKELSILNKTFKEEGLPVLKIRIGINTGDVIHGNLGARGKKLNYTIIGDNVNLASRLEGVNKIYSTEIIVSKSVYLKTKDDFIFRELDDIIVKGKEKSVKIFELIGFKDCSYDKALLENYSLGLEKIYLGEYEKALAFFIKNITKDDGPSLLMIKRCKEHLSGTNILTKGAYKIVVK